MLLSPTAARRPLAWLSAVGAIALALACSPDGVLAPRAAPKPLRSTDATTPPHLAIVELMGNPGAVADAGGEWIKLYNPGPADVDLQNFKIQSASGTTVYTGTQTVESHTIASSIVVPVGSCVVLGNNTDATVNGGVNEPYSYGGSITLGNNTTDWVTIKSPTGDVLDSVAYSPGGPGSPRTVVSPTYSPPSGISRSVIDPSADHTVMSSSNWQDTPVGTTYGAGDRGTPNTCTYTWRVSPVEVGPIVKVTVTPDPATVATGQTLTLHATATDANGNTVTSDPARFTWTSDNSAVATVSAAGVVTGVAVSTTPVSITATSTDVPSLSASASVTVTKPPAHVTVSSRSVPLPVGFQTQLFADGTDGNGADVSGQTITWSSSDENVLTVDSRGVITAAGVGSAKIRATVPDGSFGETTVTTESQFFRSTARAGHNTELGVPTDADASDDIIIARKEYTISFNPRRGGPNWVSWDLDASHLGSTDRCNCFTADTALARLGYGSVMYTTADYIAGGQWDRGHMEPSADQTTTDTENGTTFFLSNILPQRHDLNAGPWEKLEIALRDSAKAGREVYQIAGGIFANGVGLGTLNDAGKIAIPDHTWKIAVIMPADGVLSDITSAQSVTVIAVNMPNVTGIQGNGWEQYRTTVAAIQQATGYDFLSGIPEQIQCSLEGRNCAPTVAAFAGATILRGETYTASGTFSDPNAADQWTATVNYGDGTGTQPLALSHFGFELSHAYTTSGTFTVTVKVTDNSGAYATRTAQVVVESAAQGIAHLKDAVNGAGVRTSGEATSLQAELSAAAAALDRGDTGAAVNALVAFLNEVDAMRATGRINASSADALSAYARRVISSIGG